MAWTKEEEDLLWENLEKIENREVTFGQVAEKIGKIPATVYSRYRKLGGERVREKKLEYALYKNEELEIVGTISEIAKHRGVKEDTIFFYGSSSNKKRNKKGTILVKLSGQGDLNAL